MSLKNSDISHSIKKGPYTMGRIGFGGAGLSGAGGGYGFGPIENENKLIEAALETGITFFDTAPIYGFNQSEKVLGKCLKNYREDVEIISKSGVSWHSNMRVNMTNDPETTRDMLESSLRNLNTDYIDIYMIHWPDPKIDIRYPLEVLIKAKDEGKITHIGLCNTNTVDLNKSLELTTIDYIQNECNLFYNGFIETQLALDITKHNIKTIGWGTFDKGILAGSVKLNSSFDKTDARSWAPWWKKSKWKNKVQKVIDIEKKFDEDILRAALSYSLNEVDISLCGIKKEEHLTRVSQVVKSPLESNLLKEIHDEFQS